MSNPNASPRTSYWLCPLYSFNCDSESVDLAEGMQIKPAPDVLRKYIAERTRHLYGRWEDPSKFDWAIFLAYRAKATEGASSIEKIKIGLEEWDEAKDSLIDLITALRLCHKGQVTAGPLISASRHNSEWSIGGGTIWTLVSKRDFLREEPEYILQQSDVPHVNELVNKLSKLRRAGKLDSLGIALRRFHSAYYGDIEDRIIDQMIAFESLYLGDIQELTYKLALRVALLLGKRGNKRETIFNNMKKAYKYRSRIVHGDTQVSREELRGIIHKSEDYLRQSMRRFLSLLSKEPSLKEIRDHLLDENILKNGKLLTS